MPTLYDIEQAIFEKAPKELAMEWDNVGLLVGRLERPAQKILVALDITLDVAEEAIALGADLIVAHHPLMNCAWSKVQTIRNDNPQGQLLLRLIECSVGAVCMHTNLDKARGGVNDALAARLELGQVEELEGGEGILRMGTIQEQSAPDFAGFVKEALGANGVRFVDAGRPVRRVAVGGGACSGYFKEAAQAGCDALVTADVQYDRFLDAKAMGLTLIDAGHYPTENVVCSVLENWLKERFPDVEVVRSKVHREVCSYL